MHLGTIVLAPSFCGNPSVRNALQGSMLYGIVITNYWCQFTVYLSLDQDPLVWASCLSAAQMSCASTVSDVDDSEPQASDSAGDTDSETSSPAGLRLLLKLTPHLLYTCIFVYLYIHFVNRCILYIFVFLYIFPGASCILYYTYICICVRLHMHWHALMKIHYMLTHLAKVK